MSRNLKTYSQNQEDLFVLKYFGDYRGTLLSIGENDGLTLSNARLLIEMGWKAHLIEPASVFTKLQALYAGNDEVQCYNYGIGDKAGVVPFYESSNHVPGGADKALVSSVDYEETVKWRNTGVEFSESNIQLKTFGDFWIDDASGPDLDFISIDAEGFDWAILQQIPLDVVKCKCLCIEWNGDFKLGRQIRKYCAEFNMRLAHENRENLIFIR